MNNDKNKESAKEKKEREEKKKKREKEIDEEIEQTFPASDPPSYSKPGNDEDEKRNK